MHVIKTLGLSKSYGPYQVLQDVNIELEAGKLVGFLGPNGAGKTTAIRILLGLLAASSGDAFVLGRSSRHEGKAIRRDIGYLPGDVHFYPNLTGRATLDFLARCRRQDCVAECLRLAELFDLELAKKVRNYSTGMKQKLGLIQALMHRPQLLVLDEPTSALDPLVRKSVFEELQRVIADGRSVLFSSHSLNEVEQICDEVIILRAGRVVEHQQIELLKSRALRRIEIVFSDSHQAPLPLPEELHLTDRSAQLLKGTWTGSMDKLLNWIQPMGVADLIIERPDLNDLFMAYYTAPKEKTAKSLIASGPNSPMEHVDNV